MRAAPLAFLVALPLLGACGTTPQPADAQLATACNGIAASYRSAAALRAQGKLSPEQIQALTDAEPAARAVCDPTKPPPDATTALTMATAALAAATQAQAGVK